ncbi:MAG: Tyrosine recombinase XerC [Acinetobacter bereziniae]|uniref:Tyrosine recombinase XerC n=1 Tax=Acinetobacter bereziniae TaxID=106648 RepID=A0A833PHN2_ACIBZ|nr:MAG: Tyrosine recombinase XerC [Acinetobacter bereziniae]
MGRIVTLNSKTKGTRYKAIIQIRRKDAEYFDCETFSTKALAKAWLKKQEDKLEKNPELLSTFLNVSSLMTLGSAIKKYLEEVKDFGRSKAFTLNQIQFFDIAEVCITELKRTDYGEHARRRAAGYENQNYQLKPVKPATINFDLQCIKSVLDYAELVWGLEINLVEFEKAIKGLRKARIVGDSEERSRLISSEELQQVTTFSYYEFNFGSRYVGAPMYLLIWLCIYTGRRLNELVRLKTSNYDRENKKWFIEGIKHPNGSKGNDKWFMVSSQAEKIIELLLEPNVRKKMLCRGGDSQFLIPFTADAIDKNWRRIRDLLGIEDLHFHDFRHEAATRLAEQGLTIPQIQQYTLHDDWNSLKRYVNLDIIRKSVLGFDDAMKIAKNTPISGIILK